jgi:hypothetical protein
LTVGEPNPILNTREVLGWTLTASVLWSATPMIAIACRLLPFTFQWIVARAA